MYKKYAFFFTSIKEASKKILLLVVALLLTNCGEDADKTNKLILGTSGEYPPFEFRKDGVLVGFDIDLAKAFAKEQGMELEIKDMEFSGLIAALNSGVIDFAISAITPTDERRKIVDFSDSYYQGYATLVTKKDNTFKNWESLQGKTVGTQMGSVWEKMAQERSKSITGLKIHSLTKTPMLLEELKIGRVDAVIIEKDQAEAFVKSNKDLTYHVLEKADTSYAAAFKKGSPLVAEFNQILKKLKVSGELDNIEKNWFSKNK